MTQESLHEKVDVEASNTNYRFITRTNDLGSKRYLQFKSTKNRMSFPQFWRTHEVEVWRYVPNERQIVRDFVDEETCPTRISSLNDLFYANSSVGMERSVLSETGPIISNYPRINDFFSYLNRQRDSYLKRQDKDSRTPTEYIN